MYEVKGKDQEENHKFYLFEHAVDVEDACKMAREEGLVEIFAVYLSKYNEVIRSEKNDGSIWYCATAVATFTNDNGKEKKQRYKVILDANDVAQATAITESQLVQGYDMVSVSIAETRIDDVISLLKVESLISFDGVYGISPSLLPKQRFKD